MRALCVHEANVRECKEGPSRRVFQVEATKFTEVGFHGKDVDTIIRDLMDAALTLTRYAPILPWRANAEYPRYPGYPGVLDDRDFSATGSCPSPRSHSLPLHALRNPSTRAAPHAHRHTAARHEAAHATAVRRPTAALAGWMEFDGMRWLQEARPPENEARDSGVSSCHVPPSDKCGALSLPFQSASVVWPMLLFHYRSYTSLDRSSNPGADVWASSGADVGQSWRS